MERASFLGSGAESHPFPPPAATCPLPDTRDHLPVILLSPGVSVCAEAIGIKPSPGLAQAENTPFSLLAGTNRERCGRTAPGNGATPGSSDEPFRARLPVMRGQPDHGVDPVFSRQRLLLNATSYAGSKARASGRSEGVRGVELWPPQSLLKTEAAVAAVGGGLIIGIEYAKAQARRN